MWAPEIIDHGVPDADLLYPGDRFASEAEAAGGSAGSRGVISPSCGPGYTGLSVALVGLLGLVVWAWHHGLRPRRWDP